MPTENGYRNLPRRRFNREFKREVVELLNEQAATVAEVARTYELHPNQLFRWRTEYFRGVYGPVDASASRDPVLLPVELADADDVLPAVAEPQNAQKYRSEEHTSELQSLMRISYAVFCLKNKKLKKQHSPLSTTYQHNLQTIDNKKS